MLSYSFKKFYKLYQHNLTWKDDKTASICLRPDKKHSAEFGTGFLRGLIDTDGYKRTDHRRYVYASVSKELRDNFGDILESLEIEHTRFAEDRTGKPKWKPVYKTRIT